jgi:hypothetical protein
VAKIVMKDGVKIAIKDFAKTTIKVVGVEIKGDAITMN